MTDRPQVGDVWRYPYLWAREDRRGETEGRKQRPCAMAVLLATDDGREYLFLLAMTTRHPLAGSRTIEVPETERRRAGLSGSDRVWVILDEHNVDVFETSYYLEPGSRIGSFSAQFRKQVQNDFLRAVRDRRSVQVKRHDG